MIESLTGLILIIGSGLIGRDVLLKKQPVLKPTLHHLEAYRDAIGLVLSILSLGGVYHSMSTALTHQYTPVFWCVWSLSNLCGLMLGIALCFDLWDPKLSSQYPRIHQIGAVICALVSRYLPLLCWSGLALGGWRSIHPWIG
jgi:hypothetical protein